MVYACRASDVVDEMSTLTTDIFSWLHSKKDSGNRIVFPRDFENFGGETGGAEIAPTTRYSIELQWGLQTLESEIIREDLLIKIVAKEGLEHYLKVAMQKFQESLDTDPDNVDEQMIKIAEKKKVINVRNTAIEKV